MWHIRQINLIKNMLENEALSNISLSNLLGSEQLQNYAKKEPSGYSNP
jgi:hypothetical protein